MRGSPLIRFFLLSLSLVFAGFGLVRLTSTKVLTRSTPEISVAPPTNTTDTPFHLTLSAPVSEISIDTGIEPVLKPAGIGSTLSGSLALDPENPRLSLTIRWKNPPLEGEHRFAKLTLEPVGQPTFSHVFDSPGNIDEFLELPLP